MLGDNMLRYLLVLSMAESIRSRVLFFNGIKQTNDAKQTSDPHVLIINSPRGEAIAKSTN